MRWTNGLGLGLMMLAACGRDSTGPRINSNQAGGAGEASAHGTVFGVTSGPDSTFSPLGGVTVTLVRIGDLPGGGGGGGGVDTTFPPPASRFGRVLTPADTVVPPNPPPPPPPTSCADAPVAATVTTGADGHWAAAGLVEGLYAVRAEPAANAPWSASVYCGLPISNAGENAISLYLTESPGPDPIPGGH